jgi:putative SOS response-associated peptidase YedK
LHSGTIGLLAQRCRGPILSFTIVTCEPNQMLAELHNRMPVILPREHYDAWGDPANQDTGGAAGDAETLSGRRDARVSSGSAGLGNNDKQLVNPLQNLSIYVSNG